MPNEIEIENRIKEVLAEVFKDLIINTKQTFDILLKEKNPADLIALYDFYYYTAKWQKTNQPKATIHYVMKGLKWGEQKVRSRKRQLVKLGLVSDIRKANKNKYLGWYIKINYIWGANTILDRVKTTLLENNRVNTTLPKTTLLENNTVETKPTNALSDNNINALSDNKNSGSASPSPPLPLKENKEESVHELVVNLFDYYNAEFVKLISESPPIFAWAKCEALVKPYLKRLGLEKMKKMVDKYLDSDNKFYQQSKWSLEIFLTTSVLNALQ